MKLKTFIILYLLCTNTAHCQTYLMLTTNNRSIYVNWNNEVDLITQDKDCDKFRIATDNGTITATDGKCRYILVPSKAGAANVTIYHKKSKAVCSRIMFSVKEIPTPLPMVANKPGGNIEKKMLEVQTGITIQSDGFHSGLIITGYSVGVIRKQNCLFNRSVNGAYFGDEVKSLFQSLEVGDHVLFTNIFCKYHDNRSQMLQPLEFVVVE